MGYLDQIAPVPKRRKDDGSDGPETDSLLTSDWRRGSARLPPETFRLVRKRIRTGISTKPSSLADERKRAAAIVDRSKAIVAQTFDDARSGRDFDIDALVPVVDAISCSMARNAFAVTGLTRIKARHEYTYVHSVAVCAFMIGLARELGLEEDAVQEIGLAGLLHDIGKARMPTAVLDKNGPLDADERRKMLTHPEQGHKILRRIGCRSEVVLDVCLHHHERFDGSGYPEQLAGDGISIAARIAAICDVYDAVTSSRPYKERWSPGRALEWMTQVEGHFDRRMLTAFRRLVGAFPVGTLVRLTSGRLAVVVDGNGDSPSSPPVIAFHCGGTNRPLDWSHVDSGADPILTVERPDAWKLADWEDLRDRLLAA